MVTAVFPDKWVRKAFKDRIHNIMVSGVEIPCYDTRTLTYFGDRYVILGSQTNIETKTKCGSGWRSTIVVEIFTRHNRNTGSRVNADDIVQSILSNCENLTLSPDSGLSLSNIERDAPNDITDITDTGVVHRKFIRYSMEIN